MKRDRHLPSGWPDDWPQNIEEFRTYLATSDKLRRYLEDRGIELRYNRDTDIARITKK